MAAWLSGCGFWVSSSFARLLNSSNVRRMRPAARHTLAETRLEFLSILDEARLNVIQSPYGDLHASFQSRIWSSFASAQIPKNSLNCMRRRVYLEALATQRILSSWSKPPLLHLHPQTLVDLALDFTHADLDLKLAKQYVYYDYSSWFRGVAPYSFDSLPITAAINTLTLAVVAHEGGDIVPSYTDYNFSNDDLEFEDLTPSHICAMYASNGLPHNPNSLPNLRRDFWLWWLEIACVATARLETPL